MKTTITIVASLALATAARADVTIELSAFRAERLDFVQMIAPGELVGNLVAISVDATLANAKQRTQAKDLCVYLDAPPLSVDGVLQVGGGTPMINAWNPPITEDGHPQWGSGASGLDGTIVTGRVDLRKPIPMTDSPLAVFVGNGYGSPWSEGTWTGTITLHGVSVPGKNPSPDLNGDGSVNGIDIAMVLAGWGSDSPDIDGDGTVNGIDLAILLAAWTG
jgi:hypothetical protein